MRLAFALGALGALFLLGSCTKRIPGPLDEGRPALTLDAVGPEPYSPGDLSGKVVLVQFVTTWCFTCLEDLPNSVALQSAYGARGLQILLVGIDLEGRKVMEPFAYHYRLPFPVLVADDRIRSGESPFGRVAAVPTAYLFGRDGKLLFAWQGLVQPKAVAAAVEQALQG